MDQSLGHMDIAKLFILDSGESVNSGYPRNGLTFWPGSIPCFFSFSLPHDSPMAPGSFGWWPFLTEFGSNFLPRERD